MLKAKMISLQETNLNRSQDPDRLNSPADPADQLKQSSQVSLKSSSHTQSLFLTPWQSKQLNLEDMFFTVKYKARLKSELTAGLKPLESEKCK